MQKNRIDLVTEGWQEYELLDSGNNRKLERFGLILLDRPDPQALWKKTEQALWSEASAQFSWVQKGERWIEKSGMPESWNVSWESITLELSLKQFKHVGIFPEHAVQWKELQSLIKKSDKKIRALNLFGYTGAASLAAAQAGASITHVDASKQTITTVKENMMLSNLPKDSIRLICEDALKYARRLVSRGEQFEVIMMDPPAFGRGPKGEVWKIEEKLSELIALVPKLMSMEAELVILNGYAAGYSARSFGELLGDACKDFKGKITYGDIGIRQANSDRILTTGIYSKWNK